jgi:hypothetical protein
VSYTSDITHADEKVINALFTTLNNDLNVNVRLVALEALTQFAKDAIVREGLVKSLAVQDSPMVQVALADVMVKLQEKGLRWGTMFLMRTIKRSVDSTRIFRKSAFLSLRKIVG